MQAFYTSSELVAMSGLYPRMIDVHARRGWLKGRAVSRKSGYRFAYNAVKTWAEFYLRPTVSKKVLEALTTETPTPTPSTPPVWMQCYDHDSAHLVNDQGRAVCDPQRITGIIGKNWHPHDRAVKKCTRCFGRENL